MEHYFTNNDNLKSEFRTIVYKNNSTFLTFTSDLGVFSKDKIDLGSSLLVEQLLKNIRENVSILDVGCGYGFIGLTLAKLANTKSTLVDVNKRAIHLSKINAKNLGVNAEIYESNIYDSVVGKFDYIITNPPIRTGKQTVYSFLSGAKDFLNKDGELWFVMRKDHGVKSMMALLEDLYTFEIKEKSKGFYIICAKSR